MGQTTLTLKPKVQQKDRQHNRTQRPCVKHILQDTLGITVKLEEPKSITEDPNWEPKTQIERGCTHLKPGVIMRFQGWTIRRDDAGYLVSRGKPFQCDECGTATLSPGLCFHCDKKAKGITEDTRRVSNNPYFGLTGHHTNWAQDEDVEDVEDVEDMEMEIEDMEDIPEEPWKEARKGGYWRTYADNKTAVVKASTYRDDFYYIVFQNGKKAKSMGGYPSLCDAASACDLFVSTLY